MWLALRRVSMLSAPRPVGSSLMSVLRLMSSSTRRVRYARPAGSAVRKLWQTFRYCTQHNNTHQQQATDKHTRQNDITRPSSARCVLSLSSWKKEACTQRRQRSAAMFVSLCGGCFRARSQTWLLTAACAWCTAPPSSCFMYSHTTLTVPGSP